MKKKSIRILSIVAVMILAFSVATTAFAATVSTSTQYLVGADNINKIQVTSNISSASPASKVSYQVVAGTNAEPSTSNLIYINEYEVDSTGAAEISYKIDTTSANFPVDYKTTVTFGSTANDTFEGGSLSEIENYRAYYNDDGSVNFLPVQGKEIASISKNGSPVTNSLALTQTAAQGDLFTVTTQNISSNAVGDDKVASVIKTVDNDHKTVNYLFQPVAGSGIQEIGIKYGQLLFPSLAEVADDPFIGITNVKLDFSTATNVDGVKYTFEEEAAKCRPYYIDDQGNLYYYNYTTGDFIAGTLED